MGNDKLDKTMLVSKHFWEPLPRLVLLFLAVWGSEAQDGVATSLKARRGGSVTLTCFADHESSPTISWTKTIDGKAITVAYSVNGSPVIDDMLNGRAQLNGGRLEIDNLQITDSGIYSCRILATGNAKAADITLDVTAAPTVSAEVVRSPIVGSNGKYQAAICRAKGGKPRAQITWTNAAGQIQNSIPTIIPAPDGSYDVTSVLELAPGLSPDFTGDGVRERVGASRQEFTCLVNHDDLSSVEAKTSSVVVDLLYAPLVHITLLGNRLTCEARGNPKPGIKWILPNGDVVMDVRTIHLSEGTLGDGRYACVASSVLKPDATSTLMVQRARDLPTLFRTVTHLNTSLPVSASGYRMECSAHVTETRGLSSGAFAMDFEWTKDGRVINTPSSDYDIVTTHERLNTRRSVVTSRLRFVDVRRGRDDATFRCRLTNTSKSTGFVTAVERAVTLSIDYPPDSNGIRIFAEPRHAIVNEGEDLELSCRVQAKPKCNYDWYLHGQKVERSHDDEADTLTLPNVRRFQAGVYKCVAYNYVPGSAEADVLVVVRYPPSDLEIRRSEDGNLSCVTKTGSFPPPIYRWIFPNGTETKGNQSTVRLEVTEVDEAAAYTCVVHNGLSVKANLTYLQLPPPPKKIGELSVAEFSATVVVCSCVFLVLLSAVCWLTYRRCKMANSAEVNLDNKFDQYMQYSEPPGSAAMSDPGRTSTPLSLIPRCQSDLTPATCDQQLRQSGKFPIKEVSYAHCKSPLSVERQAGFGSTPSSLQTFSFRSAERSCNPRHSPSNKGKGGTDLEGSSVEIIENESLHSTLNANRSQNSTAEHDGVKRQPGTRSPQRKPPQTLSAKPPMAPTLEERRNSFGQSRCMTSIPLQYFHQSTIPRTYLSRLNYRQQGVPPVGVVIPSYDAVLYDDTWRPGMARCAFPEGSHVRPYATLDIETRKYHQKHLERTIERDESASGSMAASEDNLHGVKCHNRPRSMSLSGSDTSGSTTASSESETITRNGQQSSTALHSKPASRYNHASRFEKQLSPVRTASPFDSGNDSVKSIPSSVAAGKKQSLTLV